jgi:exosortase/archaeosortase family protein
MFLNQFMNPLYYRLILFLSIWKGLIPLLFMYLTPFFHLHNYAHFTYSTIITLIIFLVIIYFHHQDFEHFKYKLNRQHAVMFLTLALSLMFIYLHLYDVIKYLYSHHFHLASWLQLTLVYGTLILMYLSLFLAIFGIKFIKHFKKQAYLFMIFNFVYYGLFYALFPHWGIFSQITSKSVYYLLRFFYPGISMVLDGNKVGLQLSHFSVGIGEACSGVMLILLFVTLYSLFCFIKPQQISIKKSLMFLGLGTIGAFSLNILRVSLLMIIGTYNADWAMGLFHDNASWILFVSYFLVFLYATYPLVLRQNLDPPKHRKQER